jgi:alkylation response protein AidB-like acyl-CoA dehydrogenase
VQFGQQTGGFQAVKHKIANIELLVENAKSLVYYAAWVVDGDAA